MIFVLVTSNGGGIHHSTVTFNTLHTTNSHSISRSTCVFFIKNCVTIAKRMDPNKHRVQYSKLNKCQSKMQVKWLLGSFVGNINAWASIQINTECFIMYSLSICNFAMCCASAINETQKTIKKRQILASCSCFLFHFYVPLCSVAIQL